MIIRGVAFQGHFLGRLSCCFSFGKFLNFVDYLISFQSISLWVLSKIPQSDLFASVVGYLSIQNNLIEMTQIIAGVCVSKNHFQNLGLPRKLVPLLLPRRLIICRLLSFSIDHL